MHKITPFLWFDSDAEEAIGHYLSIFPNGKILDQSRGPDGRLFTATIEIEGQRLMLLNGGPMYKHTEAFSLFVRCDTQEEVDTLWDKLCQGGSPNRCGWLKDKFGVSWQIIPTALGELLGDKDREKAGRVMQAMLGMQKIEIEGLQRAYRGE